MKSGSVASVVAPTHKQLREIAEAATVLMRREDLRYQVREGEPCLYCALVRAGLISEPDKLEHGTPVVNQKTPWWKRWR